MGDRKGKVAPRPKKLELQEAGHVGGRLQEVQGQGGAHGGVGVEQRLRLRDGPYTHLGAFYHHVFGTIYM